MLLEGVQVYVGPFLKRSDRPNDHTQKFTNVYVKNLADTVDEEMLRKLFDEHGAITSIVIMRVLCCTPCLLVTDNGGTKPYYELHNAKVVELLVT